MQKLAGVTLAVLLLGALPADAAGLAFHPPASFAARELETKSVEWALLVFTNQTDAAFDLESRVGVELTNDTIQYALLTRSVESRRIVEGRDDHTDRWLPGPLGIKADFRPSESGSALIVAEQIDLTFEDAKGTLRTKSDGASLDDFSRPEDTSHDLYRKNNAPGDNDVVLSATPAGQGASRFRLATHGAARIEWYNARVTCSTSDCPTGGGPRITQIASVAGQTITSEYHTYETLEGISSLEARGTLDYAVLGSTNLTLSLAGSVRLPLARGAGLDCQGCLAPDGQTLAAAGNLTLNHLHRAPDGSITGDMGGDIETARLDETWINPDLLFRGGVAIGAAVAVGGGLAILYFFGPLFTWNREEDLLRSPRRRRIYDVVLQNPGIGTREALRMADVPAGSGRHHVNRMVEAGLLMAQRDQGLILLFENHGKYKDNWRDTATLRDSCARQLVEWLSTHPESPQKAVLDAFETECGWNRSTTQKRLDRLQRDGMVESRVYGRYKLYKLNGAARVVPPSTVLA